MQNLNGHHRIVNAETFGLALRFAQAQSEQIWRNTSAVADVVSKPEQTTFCLSIDCLSGFAVRDDGELVGVFSLVKGRGNEIVQSAIFMGATKLDCFEGYLTALYGRHGFVETRRERNWSPTGPDVVWMQLKTPENPNPHRYVAFGYFE